MTHLVSGSLHIWVLSHGMVLNPFFKKVFGYSPAIGAIIVSVGIDFKQIVTRAYSSGFLSR